MWTQNSRVPLLVLAPMDDVTDTVFRRVISWCAAPDVYFTEFVSVDGLCSPGRQALQSKLQYTPDETPLVAQLWGMQPDNYRTIAAELSTMGYAGLDINMGCPAPVVIKQGACSALINNRPLAAQIITATKEGAGDVPVSVKCRIGYSQIDLSWIEFLLRQEIAVLTVHGRTTKELSKVPNHWEVFAEIIAMRNTIAPDTLIIGNGDVQNAPHARQLAEDHSLDGVMIGRGVFKDPYAFADVSPWQNMSASERLELYRRHILLFEEVWGGQKNPASLKRFAKVYVNGFPGAGSLRDALMQTNDTTGMLSVLHPFLNRK